MQQGRGFHPADERSGHPRGLAVLCLTEAWERFSYYGMIGLLVLYMTDQLLTPGHVERIAGFAAFRAGTDALFGVLSPVALAAQVVGLYSGLVYITPLLGGWLGDRILGQRRTVVIGCVLMAIGHFLMASEVLFLAALACLVVGAGCIKGNMAAQVGMLYQQDDPRRTRAFAIYLIALNVGALLAPLICGTLGERVGWHYGFGAAGIGMLIALVTYIVGQKHLPPDQMRGARSSATLRLQPGEARRIAALMALLIPYVLFFSAYNQAFDLFPLWAQDHVDRGIGGFDMPVTWFFTLDGLLTILGTVLAIRLWRAQAQRGWDTRDLTKIGIGCALCAAAFGLLGVAATSNGRVPIVATVGFFILVDFGIPFVDTVTLAVFSRAAPPALNTTLVSVYYLAFALANITVGWLGRFYETLTPSAFWLMHAAIGAAGVVFVFLFGRRLERALERPQ